MWNQPWNSFEADLAALLESDRDAVQILVAEAGGELVSTATSAVRRGTEFATTTLGATLPEWRGRGIFSALVARRVQFARDHGAKYLHTDSSAELAPILRRLGFHKVTTATPYLWVPPR